MSGTRVVVLGGGMVGSAIAADLHARGGFDVTLADRRPAALAAVSGVVHPLVADLGDPAAVTRAVEPFDLVVGALPSTLGLQTLRAVIEAGRSYVDISFMSEDARQLSPLAVERGVTAVVDCGIAPGLSNLAVGWAAAQLAVCERVEIYVGGLPVERRWPFEYKAGFAPHDVIEEYVRPARLVEGGQVVVKDALSEPELLDFPGLGTLEAFNTDGLRSLADSVGAEVMIEKTLRYPGHVALVRALRETGFFSKEPLRIGEALVRPLDVTAAVLFPKWTFAPGEADLTVWRVTVTGRLAGGGRRRYAWDLLDRYDPTTGLRSMSRTTAFPAVIVAGLIAQGRFRRPGVHAPEVLGAEPGVFDAVLAGLHTRGVHVRAQVEDLE